MPKTNPIEESIPKLYRRNALNLSMFAFIRGVRAALPTVSVPLAIDMFMEHYGLNDDNFNRGSARNTYNFMQKELLTFKRTDNG